jgi:hypothetical protein
MMRNNGRFGIEEDFAGCEGQEYKNVESPRYYGGLSCLTETEESRCPLLTRNDLPSWFSRAS